MSFRRSSRSNLDKNSEQKMRFRSPRIDRRMKMDDDSSDFSSGDDNFDSNQKETRGTQIEGEYEEHDEESEDIEEGSADEDMDDSSKASADPFDFSDESTNDSVEAIYRKRDLSKQRSLMIPRSEVEDSAHIRFVSLSRHRHVLQPFITEKVYEKLEACVSEAKSLSSKAHIRVLDNSSIDIVHQQPKTITNCTMRQYQLEGLNWMIQQYEQRINSVLGDEMGLGKTLQSIAFTAHILHVKKLSGPFLFIVPLTVMFNWMNEFKKFCPTIRVLRMHSNDAEEQTRLIAKMKDLSNVDAVITTYETVKQGGMSMALRRQVWRAVFLDEGHRIRNEETQVSKACFGLSAIFKVVLSGTPLQNNLKEAGTILKFLAPNIFVDLSLFDTAFNLTEKSIDRDLLNKAHYMMRTFLLRRIKAEVEQKLPPKLETKIDCPMTKIQKELTQFLLFRERKILERLERMQNQTKALKEAGEDGGDIATRASDRTALMGLLAHLRKAANHPYLFEGLEDVEDPLGRATKDIVNVSGKMKVLDKLLKKLQEKGHRVVLFSQFVRTLDIICDYLEYRGYKYLRLDGQTNRVMREVRISLYNRKGSEYFLFCVSTRAGGEGVNLFTADTVILFDSDWNPQVDIQAMARVHRIGQTKTVHIYRLVTTNSVEEMIVHRAQKKLFLDSMVNRGSTAQGKALDEHHEGKDMGGEDDEEERPVKRRRKDAEETTSEADGGEGQEDDEDEAGAPKASKIFEVLKFGWQSVFAPKNQAKKSRTAQNQTEGVQQEEDEDMDATLTDADIDRLIDRTRGLNSEAEPSSTASPSSAEGKRNKRKRDEDETELLKESDSTANLEENQEQNVLQYNENEPLASIDSLRMKYFMDFESKAKNNNDVHSAEDAILDKVDAHDATTSKDVVTYNKNKRNRTSRTQTIHVSGLGEVQVFRENEMQSLAHYGHRNEVGNTATKNIMREFMEHLRETKAQNASGGGPGTQSDAVMRGGNNGTTKKHEFIVLEGKGRQVAGRDFQHEDMCQICWDGGHLILCDLCPCCYHEECLLDFNFIEIPKSKNNNKKNMKKTASAILNSMKRFSCPHHSCYSCRRSSSAAGLLFRCEHCACAYCEDCLPPEAEILGECPRFQELGYRAPSSACYIRCSIECQKHDPTDQGTALSSEHEDEEEDEDEQQHSDGNEESTSEAEEEEKSVIDLFDSDQEIVTKKNNKPSKSSKTMDEKKNTIKKGDSRSSLDKMGKQGGVEGNEAAASTQATEKDNAKVDKVNNKSTTAGMKSRFDVAMALSNCALPDIQQRLSRDEHMVVNTQNAAQCRVAFPISRFLTLSEVPNIVPRYLQASGVAKIALKNVLYFINEQNKLPRENLEIVANAERTDAASENTNMVFMDIGGKALENETSRKEHSEENALFDHFTGIDPSRSTQFKTNVFFAALKMMSSLQRQTLPQIAQILGICTPSFIKKTTFYQKNKFSSFICEPKFTFNIGNNIQRGILEESIAAFLVVLSPLNMLIPSSVKDKNQSTVSTNEYSALVMQYEKVIPRVPSNNNKAVANNNTNNASNSVTNNVTKTSDSSDVQVQSTNTNETTVGDTVNTQGIAKVDKDKSDESSSDDSDASEEEEKETVQRIKRFDGLMFLIRLLQALGEMAVDENGQYFTAAALVEISLPGLQMYRLQNHSASRHFSPATTQQKLAWLWPVIRIFRHMLTDTCMRNILRTKSPSNTSVQVQPRYEMLMDLDNPNLIAYLSQAVLVMCALRIHYHRTVLAVKQDTEPDKAVIETPQQIWFKELAFALDESPFAPTCKALSRTALEVRNLLQPPTMQQLQSHPSTQENRNHPSGKLSASTTIVDTSAKNNIPSHTDSDNKSSNAEISMPTKDPITKLAFKMMTSNIEFTAWVTKSNHPVNKAYLTSIFLLPETLAQTIDLAQAELLFLILWLNREFDVFRRTQVTIPVMCDAIHLPQAVPFMVEQCRTRYAFRGQSGLAHLKQCAWRQSVSMEVRHLVLKDLHQLLTGVNDALVTYRDELTAQRTAELTIEWMNWRKNPSASAPPTQSILAIPIVSHVEERILVYEWALLAMATTMQQYDNPHTLSTRLCDCISAFVAFIAEQARYTVKTTHSHQPSKKSKATAPKPVPPVVPPTINHASTIVNTSNPNYSNSNSSGTIMYSVPIPTHVTQQSNPVLSQTQQNPQLQQQQQQQSFSQTATTQHPSGWIVSPVPTQPHSNPASQPTQQFSRLQSPLTAPPSLQPSQTIVTPVPRTAPVQTPVLSRLELAAMGRQSNPVSVTTTNNNTTSTVASSASVSSNHALSTSTNNDTQSKSLTLDHQRRIMKRLYQKLTEELPSLK